MSLTAFASGPPPPDPLPCPNCPHYNVSVLPDRIECLMCGLLLPTNDENRYGSTVDRWKTLGKPRPDAGPVRGGDAAPGLGGKP